MDVKQRKILSELLEEAAAEWDAYLDDCKAEEMEPEVTYYMFLANRISENGVILSPCKVGDAVWFLHLKDEIAEGVVDSIEVSRYSAPEVFISVEYEDRFGEIHCRSWEENAIGKTLFFSREAAEAALYRKAGRNK